MQSFIIRYFSLFLIGPQNKMILLQQIVVPFILMFYQLVRRVYQSNTFQISFLSIAISLCYFQCCINYNVVCALFICVLCDSMTYTSCYLTKICQAPISLISVKHSSQWAQLGASIRKIFMNDYNSIVIIYIFNLEFNYYILC